MNVDLERSEIQLIWSLLERQVSRYRRDIYKVLGQSHYKQERRAAEIEIIQKKLTEAFKQAGGLPGLKPTKE